MKPTTQTVLFLWVLLTAHPVGAKRDILGRLLLRQCSAVRCGLLGLSFVMHKGVAGSDNCDDKCVMFPMFTSGMECGSCASKAYDIDMQFDGIPSSDQVYFVDAKTRWESVITGDVSDRKALARSPSSRCKFTGVVDDLNICAFFSEIDGYDGVLASASPSHVRMAGADSGLPLMGRMKFDVDDIEWMKAAGGFRDVITHEMGHILGLGTLWLRFGASGLDVLNCPYRGERASAEYETISGCSNVPTEGDGGDGTKCSHWDEECLGNEVQTGYLDLENPSPLSRITVASLEDIGYQVDYSKADPFTTDDLNSECVCDQSLLLSLHGTSRQLGPRSHSRRRLSQEKLELAIAFGQAQLEEERESLVLYSKSGEETQNSDISFIGDKIVSVLVRDGDGIFSVVVTSEG